MKLLEIMTKDVEIIHPEDNLQTAAKKMRDRDIGFLPVCEGDNVVGVLSDRDIILRSMTKGMDPKKTTVQALVSSPPIYCFEDQDVNEAVRLMHDNQIRRLIILNRDNRKLTGVVSLGDLAMNIDGEVTGEVLHGVSMP
jgi:CBS domain-containing protein